MSTTASLANRAQAHQCHEALRRQLAGFQLHEGLDLRAQLGVQLRQARAAREALELRAPRTRAKTLHLTNPSEVTERRSQLLSAEPELAGALETLQFLLQVLRVEVADLASTHKARCLARR
jgi:hypothetical protein